MIQKILAIIAFMHFSCMIAQDRNALNLISDTEVTTISYWNQGESVKYAIESREKTLKQKKDKRKELKNETVKYDLVLSILDSAEHNYKMEAFYSNFAFQESYDELTQKLVSLIEHVPILYDTDEFGHYDTLLNIKALQKSSVKMGEEFLRLNEMDNPLGQVLMQPFIEQLSKEENQTALYCAELLSIHLIQGGQWKLNKEYVLDCEFVTMNNYKVKGKALVELKKIDKKKKTAVFKVELFPNENELAKYVNDIFLALTLDLEERFDLESFRVVVSEKLTYTIDLNSGWPKYIEEFTEVKVRDKEKKFIKETDSFYRLID